MRLYLLFLTAAILLSCSSVNLSRVESSYEGISALEMKLGDRVSGLMQARYRLVYDRDLQRYITDIRRALLVNTTLDLEHGEMILVNDPGVFAYVVPNGDIYLSRGMLLFVKDEAELAVVIAHELGHLLLQHSVESHELEAGLTSMLAGLTNGGDSSDAEVFDSLVSVLHYGGSREREIEADSLMLQLLQRSVYPPAAALDLFERFYHLELEYDPANPSTIRTQVFDTHPNTRERLALIKHEVDGLRYEADEKQRFEARYQARVWPHLPVD